MKAVILTDAYKVEVQDVPKPELTDDQQVLIEVHYTGLCGACLLPSWHHYQRDRRSCSEKGRADD
jgi:threonine dehydrogenase-like Zn-dependent dehydrogenase